MGRFADVEFTAAEKLEAIRREIKYRRRVYVRLVDQKKMSQQTADKQIQLFEAIARDYDRQAASERLI